MSFKFANMGVRRLYLPYLFRWGPISDLAHSTAKERAAGIWEVITCPLTMTMTMTRSSAALRPLTRLSVLVGPYSVHLTGLCPDMNKRSAPDDGTQPAPLSHHQQVVISPL